MDVVKAIAIINLIYNTEMINLINIFSNFEFVQYEKIFQNLFYLNLWCKLEERENYLERYY